MLANSVLQDFIIAMVVLGRSLPLVQPPENNRKHMYKFWSPECNTSLKNLQMHQWYISLIPSTCSILLTLKTQRIIAFPCSETNFPCMTSIESMLVQPNLQKGIKTDHLFFFVLCVGYSKWWINSYTNLFWRLQGATASIAHPTKTKKSLLAITSTMDSYWWSFV